MSNKDKISLENRGWSQMTTVLDNELPQRKRTRRPILWLFFVSGFALAISMFLYSSGLESNHVHSDKISAHNSNGDQVTIGSEVQQLPIKETRNENIDASNKKVVGSKSSKKEPSSSFQIERAPKNTNLSNDTYDVQEPKNATDDKPIRSVIIDSSSSSSSSSSVEMGERNKVIFKTTASITNTPISTIHEVELELDALVANEVKTPKVDDVITRPLLFFNHLSGVDHMLAYTQNLDYDLEMLDDGLQHDFIKESQEDPEYYLFVEGGLGLNPNGYGYQLGFGKKFGDKKMNVFIEGGFSHMNYNEEGSDDKSVEVDIVLDETSINVEFNADLDPSFQEAVRNNQIAGDLLFTKMNSAFLSLGIEKSLNRKFNLLAGITMTRFLSIENRKVDFVSRNGLFQADLNRYNISRNTLFESDVFDKYEISMKLGIGYQISPRFILSANYNLGLTDVLNTSNDLDKETFPTGMSNETSLADTKPISVFRKNFVFRIGYNF